MEPPKDTQPEESPPVVETAIESTEATDSTEPTPSFAWEASEFVQHDKPAWWYAAFCIIVLLLCGILGWLQQWFSIAVLVIMAVAVVVYSRKEPRTLQYVLDDKGISINGRLLPYAHFHSYNVQPQVGWKEIDLEPARRFAPRLTLLADEDSFDSIEGILAQHLPQIQRDHDAIERLSRYLKF